MNKLWIIIGRTLFWLSWPASFAYLYFSRRTRIIVAVDDDVLVVRGWLSGGWWGLPGGGLHHGENPAEGAARELREETGIHINGSDLQKLYSRRVKSELGLRYIAYAYALHFSKKPKLSKQTLELTHLDWINWRTLRDNPRTSQDIREFLDAWRAKR